MATEGWWADVKQFEKQLQVGPSLLDGATEESGMEDRESDDSSHDIIISMDLLRELSLVGTNPQRNSNDYEKYTPRSRLERNSSYMDRTNQRIIYTTPESGLLSSPLAYFGFPKKTLSNLFPGERGPAAARYLGDSARTLNNSPMKQRDPICTLTLPDDIPNLDKFSNRNPGTYNMHTNQGPFRRDSVLAYRYRRLKYGTRLRSNRMERADPKDIQKLQPTVVKLHHSPRVNTMRSKQTESVNIATESKRTEDIDKAVQDETVNLQHISPSSRFTIGWVNAGDDRIKFSYSLREKSGKKKGSPVCVNSTDFADAGIAGVSPRNKQHIKSKKRL